MFVAMYEASNPSKSGLLQKIVKQASVESLWTDTQSDREASNLLQVVKHISEKHIVKYGENHLRRKLSRDLVLPATVIMGAAIEIRFPERAKSEQRNLD